MKLDSIQYLRALAALVIVIYHLYAALTAMGYRGYFPGFTAAGVDLFFVISGFIMWVTTCDGSIGVGRFYGKRLARIVPTYWAVTSVAVATMLVAPSLMKTSRFDAPHVLASFLFVPHLHPVLGTVEPVLTQGWTLNYEMFFYLIFGASLAVPRYWRLPAVLAVLIALTIVGLVSQPAGIATSFYTSSIILEFGAGMVIGSLYTRGGNLSPALAVLLVAAGIVGIPLGASWFNISNRALGAGIPAALLVAGAIYLERSGVGRRWGLLAALGDASYSIYLIHTILMAAVAHFWPHAKVQSVASLAGFSLVSVVATCGGGYALYQLFERPVANVLRERVPRSSHMSEGAKSLPL